MGVLLLHGQGSNMDVIVNGDIGKLPQDSHKNLLRVTNDLQDHLERAVRLNSKSEKFRGTVKELEEGN